MKCRRQEGSQNVSGHIKPSQLPLPHLLATACSLPGTGSTQCHLLEQTALQLGRGLHLTNIVSLKFTADKLTTSHKLVEV